MHVGCQIHNVIDCDECYEKKLKKQASAPMAGYSVDEERKQLRDAQAREVMPMIGPLLDAWEQVPNDVMADLCFQAPSLTTYMEKINHAMEIAE